MSKLVLIGGSAIALVAAATMFSASAETKSYNLSGFDGIQASAGVSVILKQGPFSVSVSERKGNFDRLDMEVRGSILHIGRKNTMWSWFDWDGPDYTVTVSAPNYEEIHASSGSEVEGEGLNLRALDVHVSSGADMDLSGACTSLVVHVSSGSDFNGEDLRCETATVEASSGADADAFASKSARGEASSGADVTFHGNPATFEKDTSSGGSVRSS